MLCVFHVFVVKNLFNMPRMYRFAGISFCVFRASVARKRYATDAQINMD